MKTMTVSSVILNPSLWCAAESGKQETRMAHDAEEKVCGLPEQWRVTLMSDNQHDHQMKWDIAKCDVPGTPQRDRVGGTSKTAPAGSSINEAIMEKLKGPKYIPCIQLCYRKCYSVLP